MPAPYNEVDEIDSTLIPRGEKLNILIDHACGNPDLGQQLQNHTFVTDRPYHLSELEDLAQADPCVISINHSVNYKTEAVPNDPMFLQQTPLSAINFLTASDSIMANTGSDVVVAVVDSGVDIDHEDLKNNMWTNKYEIPNNGIDDDCNGFVDDVYGWNFAENIPNPRPIQWKDDPGGEAHGTHVAGLLGAQTDNSKGVTGVFGKHIKIMPLSIFSDASDGGFTSYLINAVRYAADNGAQVINLSVGGCGTDEGVRDVIKYAVSKGVTVVTAAGNDRQTQTKTVGSSSQVVTVGPGRELTENPADMTASNTCEVGIGKIFKVPASYGNQIDGLIVVGSMEATPTNGSYPKSAFSVWSNTLVNIAAPGSEPNTTGLISTLPHSTAMPNGDYGRMQGTSMSSPLVAGSIAYSIYLARTKGVILSPANAEKLLGNASAVDSGLTSSFIMGHRLDMGLLSTEINSHFNNYK